jgi:hypothetical protein
VEWVKRPALLLEWHMGKPRKFFWVMKGFSYQTPSEKINISES